MQVYHDFCGYPDPDQRFLLRIRIRILANDTDPKHWKFPSRNEETYKVGICVYKQKRALKRIKKKSNYP